jgi:hypothetical protein
MGRAQEGTTFRTGQKENSEYNQEAQKNYQTAEASNTASQNDISNYSSAVGGFNASNPYGQGGAVQTAQNQESSDTAAGNAESAGQAMQGAAVRTGQNAGGAIAATENMQNQNQRSLASEEASNTVSRAAGDTSYKEAGLAGVGDVASKQTSLGAQEASTAKGQADVGAEDLSTMQKAGTMPTFAEQQMQSANKMAENLAANGPKCWLTTACTHYAGLPDDCQQLTVLRAFRDGYMRNRSDGKAMITDYYAFAPLIVEKINQSDNRDGIYRSILRMVNKCVSEINKGHTQRALNTYARCYLKLKRKFVELAEVR